LLLITRYYFGYEVKEGKGVRHLGERGNEYSVLMGKPEGKQRLERHKRRWHVNIK
jgi:hypothetical protein